jgi:predicted dehydrogenase
MHAPLHTAGAETELAGVWSARSDSAARLAAIHGVPAFRTFEELLASSEAVDFAVPPAVQADLAPKAADAGRALILEKPLGTSLGEARNVAEAVRQNSVPNIVVLTKRFHKRTKSFLASALELTAREPALGLRGTYLHGGFLQDGFLTAGASQGWRAELGALYDLGPHLLDLMDLAGGPVEAVRLDGSAKYSALTTFHAGGAVGHAALSGSVGIPAVHTTLELFSEFGTLEYTTAGMDHAECWPELRREFAAAVRTGAPVTVDVERAVRIQAIVEAAALSLAEGRPVSVASVAGR